MSNRLMRAAALSPTMLRIAVGALLVLGLVTIWGVALFSLRQDENRNMRAAETETRLLAATFAEHAEATIRLIDTAVIMLARDWVADRANFPRIVGEWNAGLAHLALQIGVADRDGLLIYSNLGVSSPPVNLADREHIRVHLDGVHEGLFVSRPLVGRVSRKWAIQFTRPVMRDGVVDGVVVVSLDPEYFLTFYKSLPLAEAATVAMVRSTGELMVEVPGNRNLGTRLEGVPFLVAGAPRFGNFTALGSTDGIARLYAFHRLPEYGLTLTAGVSLAQVLGSEDAQRKAHLAAAFAASVALILVGILGMREVTAWRSEVQSLSAANVGLEERVAERTAELYASLEKIETLNVFMRRLLNSSPAVLYTLSYPALDPTFVSSNVTAKLGWSPEDFLRDPGLWRDCVHPADRDRAVVDIERLARTGTHSMRVRFRAKDGKYLWMNHELSLIRDHEGRPAEVAGAFWDVSAHAILEQQMNQRQKLEAIGQLTGGLAHDFNNLLGIVVGNLDLIGEGLDPAHPLHKPHQAALDAAMRGVEITRLLLAVARRQPLEVARYDLNQLVEQMMPLVRSSVGSAVTVRVQFGEGPLIASLDAASLSNVVLNLVINARDAMRDRPGAKILTVRTRGQEIAGDGEPELRPGWYAVLEISDTGSGMSAEVRAQAFEPFFTTKERGKGTGLGLAMVHGYAAQLGGTVRIDSAEGVGTTMSVFLPMVGDPAALKPVDPPAMPAAPPGPHRTRAIVAPVAEVPAVSVPAQAPMPKRILVVDDEPGLCALACDWIQALGHDAVGVQTPQEALERLGAARFDLLFTDIVMPGDMDGLALASAAKARQPDLRVLLASGYARALLEARDLPGPLLSKPYRKKDVAQALDGALRG